MCPTVRCNDGFKTKSTDYQTLNKLSQKLVLTGGKYDYGVQWVKRVIGEIIRQYACRESITELSFKTTNLQLIGLIVSAGVNPLTCLGDGHSGVWNLFQEIGTTTQRQEILDWYHLKENLYKVGGSLKRLKQAETLLWQGLVAQASALFTHCSGKRAQNFRAYLNKHCNRIVNYKYFQAENLSSIGSGAVESAVKQIDRRMKISGAQWKLENLPQMLKLRTCYLNGLFAI